MKKYFIAIVLILFTASATQGGKVSTKETLVQSDETRLTMATPHEINYQGWLGNTQDTTGVTGNYDLTFRLYDADTGGNLLWTEAKTGVRVEKGIFNIYLGSQNPLPPALFTGEPLWLEVKVGTEILSPRKKLASVGYAIKSETADKASYADTAGYALGSGGGIGGSGIPNYIPKFSTSTTIGTSNIYEDSFGNVGIGTTSPAQKLSLAGSLGLLETGLNPTYYTIFQGGDQAANITYTLPTTVGTSGQVLSTDGTGTLNWITSGSESLPPGTSGQTLRHNGTNWVADSLLFNNGTNVGIGTTSPAYKVDVSGDLNASGAIRENGMAIRPPLTFFASVDTVVSTSSTTFVNYPLSLSFTLPTPRKVIFMFSASDQYNNTSNTRTFFRLLVDGVQKAGCVMAIDDLKYDRGSASIIWVEFLIAGAHTAQMVWMTTGGTTFVPNTAGVTVSLLALATE